MLSGCPELEAKKGTHSPHIDVAQVNPRFIISEVRMKSILSQFWKLEEDTLCQSWKLQKGTLFSGTSPVLPSMELPFPHGLAIYSLITQLTRDGCCIAVPSSATLDQQLIQHHWVNVSCFLGASLSQCTV